MTRSANQEKRVLYAQGKALGKSNRELAKQLCVEENTCGSWYKEPKVRELILEYQKSTFLEAQAMLLAAQKEAIETVQMLLRSRDENVRLKAAREILSQCSTFPDYAL